MANEVMAAEPGTVVPKGQGLVPTTDRIDFGNGALVEGWETVPRGFFREEKETHYQVGRVWRALIVAVAVLALLNSDRLVTMVSGLSVGPVEDTIIVMSETWHEQMELRGPARWAETIRARIDVWRETGWDDLREGDGPPEEEGAFLRGAQGGSGG